MKSLNVEILMGHDIGLANSYYKPSQQELLEDYIKSIDLFTIQDNKSKLEKQIKELKERTENSRKVIDSRLEQKDSDFGMEEKISERRKGSDSTNEFNERLSERDSKRAG
jgi:hypothetical protein